MPTEDNKAQPKEHAADAPYITGKDIAVLSGLPILFAIAWLMPQSVWPGVCAAMAGFYTRFTSAGRREGKSVV